MQFLDSEPFNHVIIDDFFTANTIQKLVEEFPSYDATGVWNAHYNSPIENKKACNHWDKFPPATYATFHYLCSTDFAHIVGQITGHYDVQADVGLHGGGWHAHTQNGKLNIHLDYSIHPKLQLQRKFNLIVYITPDWQKHWGGGLELWSHDDQSNTAAQCMTMVENKFNRAVLFDTTQNSWHGLPGDLSCPHSVMRQSLAVYYVTEPPAGISSRGKALFVPHGAQAHDADILKLIQARGQVTTAQNVYKGLK